MALDTYDGLKAAIADTIDRDDLTDQIDDFIDLAEELHRDGGKILNNIEDDLPPVRIKEMTTRAPVTINDRYLALPDGYLQAQILRILTTEAGDEVRDGTIKEVNLYQLTRSKSRSERRPKLFHNHGTEIEFDAVPDQSYAGEMVFYKAVDPLSTSNQTNAILQRSPRAYLYGACIASSPFLDYDERISTWTALYISAARGMRRADQDGKYTGPLVARVDGATP